MHDAPSHRGLVSPAGIAPCLKPVGAHVDTPKADRRHRFDAVRFDPLAIDCRLPAASPAQGWFPLGGCLVYFAVAAIATLSATELVRVIALRLGAFDRPGGRRVHRRPTARLGGLGIFWGFGVALVLAVYTQSAARAALASAGIGAIGLLAGAGVMLITGLLDDVRGLGPVSKLGMQITAATLVYLAGWRVEYVGLPGLGGVPAGMLSLPLTIGWIVFATNAVNLIDGIDGLAAGLAVIAGLTVFGLVGSTAGSGVIAVILAGAVLGFLWFNLNPALIFMGDAGSLFVGFALATLTLRAAVRLGPESFPVLPMLILAVPLVDAISAVVRRLGGAARSAGSRRDFVREARRRIMAPDRAHLHHRLLDAGFSPRLAAALLHAAAIPFALAARLLVRDPLAGWALVLIAASSAWWWRRIEARAAGTHVLVGSAAGAAEALGANPEHGWDEQSAA